MENRFVAKYPDARYQEILDLLKDSYETLPFSIVAPLSNYEFHLKHKEYFIAYKFGINFFEISIQYISGIIISLLNHHKVIFDEELQNIIEKLVSDELAFGHWVNDIFLKLVKKANDLLPSHPFIARVFAEFDKEKKDSNKKSEALRSMVTYRNKEAHDTVKEGVIYQERLENIEPLFWDILTMLHPLKSLRFFMMELALAHDGSGGTHSYVILPDSGLSRNSELRVNTDFPLEENGYYLSKKLLEDNDLLEEKDVIKISPFVIYYFGELIGQKQKKFSYIFQTVAKKNLERVVYISANKEASRKETELFKDDFLSFLKQIFSQKLIIDKFKFFFNKEKPLTKSEEEISVQNSDFINQQVGSKKFDPAVFQDRSFLSYHFESFVKSDLIAMVILGNAGAGKTNQVCYWASKQDPDYIPLAYNCKIFTTISLEAQLQKTFKSKDDAVTILTALNTTLKNAEKLVCIFFDAINECSRYQGLESSKGAIDLLLEIHELFVVNKFDRIKVLVSCRTYTWEELMDDQKILAQGHLYYTLPDQDTDHLELKGFSESEFELVYPKYESRYDLRTSLNSILSDHYAFVRARLHDPLILKTAAQNFSGKDLPAELSQFNSTRLFQQKIKSLLEADNGVRQTMILDQFTSILWREDFSDAIPLMPLRMAYERKDHPLYDFAREVFKDRNFKYSDEFVGIVDEGILRVDSEEIRFVYERFNEFLFARHFIASQPSTKKTKTLIPRAAYEEVLRKAGHSTVMIAALRNALILDFHARGNDPGTIIRLAQSQLYESQPLVEETLSVLIEESYTEVLEILARMLDFEKQESFGLLKEKTAIEKLIAKNITKADIPDLTAQELSSKLAVIDEQLLLILKVRQIAVSVIYKIFKSDHIESMLADEVRSPNPLLWTAMADPLPEVRDSASIYIYYIARYNIQLGTNIITTLSEKVKNTPVLSLLRASTRRELQQGYIEPAARVGLFLVIDGLIERRDYKLALEILEVWKEVVRKFTLNHTIIKIVMPFFKFLFARQTVVQTEYVNNGIEYRHFWEAISLKATYPDWSREGYKLLIPYLDAGTENFSQHLPLIINAYRSGDSFSYFLLERILIVQGIKDWNNVTAIIHELTSLPGVTQWKPYMIMSLIYSLFQINHKLPEVNLAAEKIFGDLVRSWSIECKGYYLAHYNNIANNNKPYKQYVLYWYASVYCNRYGDGQSKPGDAVNVPIFRELILMAYKKRDKALLYYCLDNMSVLVSASGYYKTALMLFEYLIELFQHESELEEFDEIELKGNLFTKGLRSFICDMLGTVKSYYPKEVDHFIVNKLKASHFPDLDAFREEIFNHSLSHEGIGDLLTHKFGNFAIWGILNDKDIRKFFIDICNLGFYSNSYPEWFDQCIRLIFERLFGVKNLQKTVG